MRRQASRFDEWATEKAQHIDRNDRDGSQRSKKGFIGLIRKMRQQPS